jgi:fibronectin type 3 domain-containing protein
MTQTRSACVAFCVVFILGLFESISAGASIPSLEWDPNPESYVAGYNVYSGEKSRTYTRIIDVGLQTSLPLTNLTPGVTYYFAVTAYDSNRLESPFSDEVFYTPRVNGTNASIIPFTLAVSEGSTAIQFTGFAGKVCRVVASSDLVQWEEIYTVTMTQNESIEYLDGESRSRSYRFYRIVATAAPVSGTIVY